MRKFRMLLTAAAIATLMSAAASAAPALDAAGKCRDNGKYVKASMCQAGAPAAGKCRNVKTKKFAKCGTAGTEPVPSAAPASGGTSGAK